LSGHPQGPLGEWAGESLTRFEAASLTLRAVEGLGKACQEQGQALQQIAQATPESGGDAAHGRPTGGVTAEDLAAAQRLVEEFRGELVAMGARVNNLETALKDVQSRLGKVEAEQKQHKIDGYMQLRYRDDNAPDGKREFQVRRVRVNVRGPLSERTSYRVEFQLDAKDQYDAAGTSKGTGSKVQLRTATIDYKLGRGRFQFGQAILPWGYELHWAITDRYVGKVIHVNAGHALSRLSCQRRPTSRRAGARRSSQTSSRPSAPVFERDDRASSAAPRRSFRRSRSRKAF
jgi:hypothetical protein